MANLKAHLAPLPICQKEPPTLDSSAHPTELHVYSLYLRKYKKKGEINIDDSKSHYIYINFEWSLYI